MICVWLIGAGWGNKGGGGFERGGDHDHPNNGEGFILFCFSPLFFFIAGSTVRFISPTPPLLIRFTVSLLFDDHSDPRRRSARTPRRERRSGGSHDDGGDTSDGGSFGFDFDASNRSQWSSYALAAAAEERGHGGSRRARSMRTPGGSTDRGSGRRGGRRRRRKAPKAIPPPPAYPDHSLLRTPPGHDGASPSRMVYRIRDGKAVADPSFTDTHADGFSAWQPAWKF